MYKDPFYASPLSLGYDLPVCGGVCVCFTNLRCFSLRPPPIYLTLSYWVVAEGSNPEKGGGSLVVFFSFAREI